MDAVKFNKLLTKNLDERIKKAPLSELCKRAQAIERNLTDEKYLQRCIEIECEEGDNDATHTEP